MGHVNAIVNFESGIVVFLFTLAITRLFDAQITKATKKSSNLWLIIKLLGISS